MIRGRSPSLPPGILLRATALSPHRPAYPLTEERLAIAALEQDDVVRIAEPLGLSCSALGSVLATRSQQRDATGPPEQLVGGVELEAGFYGGAAEIVGRASVLAVLPTTHAMDALDILVAALFDPLSATSHIAVLELGLDRDQFLARVAASTGRYAGAALPATDLHRMSGPISLPWSLRETVVRLLANTLDEPQWTYTRSEDRMLVVIDADALSTRLLDELRRLDDGGAPSEHRT